MKCLYKIPPPDMRILTGVLHFTLKTVIRLPFLINYHYSYYENNTSYTNISGLDITDISFKDGTVGFPFYYRFL